MLEAAYPIRSKELTLADIFTYILSDEWGKAPARANTNPCDNDHYKQANEDEDEK